jgi:galactokinase/mevalonate kinase-like predicted kinase|tara:strand:+ start:886 stop:1143 length:258 start_codon:yes stop_codon:yes gene_type:complete
VRPFAKVAHRVEVHDFKALRKSAKTEKKANEENFHNFFISFYLGKENHTTLRIISFKDLPNGEGLGKLELRYGGKYEVFISLSFF